MLLFDIGAALYFIGFVNMILFLIRRNHVTTVICAILEIIGGAIMWVAYYIVAGNDFSFEKMLS